MEEKKMEEQEAGSVEGGGYGVTFPDALPMAESRSSKGHMVYSPEMKMSLVSEFEAVKDTMSRAEFAKTKGIPCGTFDGWYWKAHGIASRSGRRKVAPNAGLAVDIKPMLASKGDQARKTVRLRVNGLEIETDSDGVRAILEAVRKC